MITKSPAKALFLGEI